MRKAILIAILAVASGCEASFTTRVTPVDSYRSETRYEQKCGGLKAWFTGCPQQPTQIEGS